MALIYRATGRRDSVDLTGIWWHGTRLQDLKSILRSGLKPGHPTRYPEGCHGFPPHWVGRDSYGGLYLAPSVGKAKSLAGGGAYNGPKALVAVVLDPTTKGVTADEDVFSFAVPGTVSAVTGDGQHSPWSDLFRGDFGWSPRPYPWDRAAELVLAHPGIARALAGERLRWFWDVEWKAEKFPFGRDPLKRPETFDLCTKYIQRVAVTALWCGWYSAQLQEAREAEKKRRGLGYSEHLPWDWDARAVVGEPNTVPTPRVFKDAWKKMRAAYETFAVAVPEFAWVVPEEDPSAALGQPSIRTNFPLTTRGKNRIILAGAVSNDWHEVVVHHIDTEMRAEVIERLAEQWKQTSETLRIRMAGGTTLYERWGREWTGKKWRERVESPWKVRR